MQTSASVTAYNNVQKAEHYHKSKGFDPPRKARMIEVMVRSVVELIPIGSRILELGAGTGDLTFGLLEAGHYQILATDGAEAMQAIAKKHPRANEVEFGLLDFSQPNWYKPLEDQFQAVVSSMALHHIEDKSRVFKEIYQTLKPGSVLIFSDHIRGASDEIQRLIELERARVKLGTEASPEEIESFIRKDQQSQANEGNRCESVESYLGYLLAGGFRTTDCIWRDYWMAAFIVHK